MRRPRRRGWLHLLLLGVSLVTLAFSGGLWEGAADDFESFGQLLRPDNLQRVLVAGLGYAFWVFAILGCHEMGHYLACRYYGIPATLPFFIPGPPPLGSFGAVIRIRGAIPNRKALFDVAAAGPIAGFVVALPVLLAGLARAELSTQPLETGGLVLGPPLVVTLFGSAIAGDGVIVVDSLFMAGWVGMLVTSLNLFPVGQLDGGHAVYALSRRGHRFAAIVTLAGMTGLIATQVIYLGQFPTYLLWFLILLWMRDRHPRLVDESTPLGLGRKLVALALLLIFVLSFMPLPFQVIE